jgi:alpha-tubulin suppressor-like RCC1 family protein
MKWVLAACVVLAALVPALTAGASTSTNAYEWGRHVAPGGPGRIPTIVQTVADLGQIDAGNVADVLVLGHGNVWTWGMTHVGPTSMSLVQVRGVSKVLQRPVDGNGDFAALEQPGTDPACPSSSTVVTWGLSESGDLGLGVTNNGTNYASDQDVTALDCKEVVQLAAANSHMVALTSSGDVYVWGGNANATLGLGYVGRHSNIDTPTLNPYAAALTRGASVGVEVTAGVGDGGLLVDGQAFSWGDNTYGQCGCSSTATTILSPTAVDQGHVRFSWIDQGGDTGSNGHELALTSSGAVYAWGDGAEGQLGQGTTFDSAVPVPVPDLPIIVDVRAGGMHSVALDAAGNAWAWGNNHDGQVGNGSTGYVLTPVEVMSGVRMISAGALHSLAAP